MSRKVIVVLILLVAAGAGCASGPSRPVTPAARDASPTSPGSAAVAPTGAANGALARTPVTYSGKTASGECASAPSAGDCRFADPGTQTHHSVPGPGHALALVGNLTYTSAAPAGSFVLFLCGKVGKDVLCTETVRGPSPLAFAWNLTGLSTATEFILGVYDTVDSPGGQASSSVYVGTDFKVEATLTALTS